MLYHVLRQLQKEIIFRFPIYSNEKSSGGRSSCNDLHTLAILLLLAQFNWTYLADTGRQYSVGLFHGDKTGHLMVYLNSKVILIDFQVLETKTYSFFIEEELCEIEVERKDDRFAYGFKINQDVDTPLNRQRKEREKADMRKGYWIAGAFFSIILIGSLIFAYAYRQKKKRMAEALTMASRPVAVQVVEQRQDSVDLRFQLEFQGLKRDYLRSVPVDAITTPFPLEAGDEFNLRFSLYKPSVNQLDFESITYTQLGRYRDRTMAVHQKQHPKLNKDQVACEVDIAFQLYGIEGLAHFYFQDKTEAVSPTFNSKTFQKLIRDLPYLEKAEACRLPN